MQSSENPIVSASHHGGPLASGAARDGRNFQKFRGAAYFLEELLRNPRFNLQAPFIQARDIESEGAALAAAIAAAGTGTDNSINPRPRLSFTNQSRSRATSLSMIGGAEVMTLGINEEGEEGEESHQEQQSSGDEGEAPHESDKNDPSKDGSEVHPSSTDAAQDKASISRDKKQRRLSVAPRAAHVSHGRSKEKKRRELEAQYAERHARVLNNQIVGLRHQLKNVKRSIVHRKKNNLDTKLALHEQQEVQRSLEEAQLKLQRLIDMSTLSAIHLAEVEEHILEQEREAANNGNAANDDDVDDAASIKHPPAALVLDPALVCPIPEEDTDDEGDGDAQAHHRRGLPMVNTQHKRNPKSKKKRHRQSQQQTQDSVFRPDDPRAPRNEQHIFQCITKLGWKDQMFLDTHLLDAADLTAQERRAAAVADAAEAAAAEAAVESRPDATDSTGHKSAEKTKKRSRRSHIGRVAVRLAVLFFQRSDVTLFHEESLSAESSAILALADSASHAAAARSAEKYLHHMKAAEESKAAGNDAEAQEHLASAQRYQDGQLHNGNVAPADDECGPSITLTSGRPHPRPGALRRESTVTKLHRMVMEEPVERELRRREVVQERNEAARECQRRAFLWVMRLDSEDAALALFQREDVPLDLMIEAPISQAHVVRHQHGTAGPLLTPLEWALRRNFTQLRDMLLLARTRLPERDHHGRTALMHAARLGLQSVADTLLDPSSEVGSLVNARDNLPRERKTAFMYAVSAAAEALWSGAGPAVQARCMAIATAIAEHRLFKLCNSTDAHGRNPAMYAVASNQFRPLLRLLLDLHKEHNDQAEARNEPLDDSFFAPDSDGRSVLTHAILAGAHLCVRDLVAYLVDTHQREQRRLAEKRAETQVAEQESLPATAVPILDGNSTHGSASTQDGPENLSNSFLGGKFDQRIPEAATSATAQKAALLRQVMGARSSSRPSSRTGERIGSGNGSRPGSARGLDAATTAATMVAAGGPKAPTTIQVNGGVLGTFVPPELTDSLQFLRQAVGAFKPVQAVNVVNTLLRLGYTSDEVLPPVRYIVSKVLSSRQCRSYLVLGERHAGSGSAVVLSHAGDSSPSRRSSEAHKSTTHDGLLVSWTSMGAAGNGAQIGFGQGGHDDDGSWSRIVLGALGHCSSTAIGLARAGARARPLLASVQRRPGKSARRPGLNGRANTPSMHGGTPTPRTNTPRSDKETSGGSTSNTPRDVYTPSVRPATSVGGRRGKGIRLDLLTAPPINHLLARQDEPDLALLPNTSGFSFGENGYIFLLVLISMAQVCAVNLPFYNDDSCVFLSAARTVLLCGLCALSLLTCDAAKCCLFRLKASSVHDHVEQVLNEAAAASARKHDELIQSYNALVVGGISGAMRKKQKARRQMEQQNQVNDRRLEGEVSQSTNDVQEPAPLNGTEMFAFRYHPAACKTYQRMRHLLETRHKSLKRPRPAHNLDVIRGTAVFSSVEGLQAGFRALQRKLSSLVSVRNDFVGIDPTTAPGPTSALSFVNTTAGRNTSGGLDMAQTVSTNASNNWRQIVEEDEKGHSDELSTSLHPDNERLEFVDREDGVLRSSGYRAIKVDFVHDANERCGWEMLVYFDCLLLSSA